MDGKDLGEAFGIRKQTRNSKIELSGPRSRPPPKIGLLKMANRYVIDSYGTVVRKLLAINVSSIMCGVV